MNIWLAVAHAEENLDYSRWWIVVEIIQLLFGTGYFDTYCVWDKTVLIPKGSGEYHIIALVEVLWKVIIINSDWCLSDSNELNDVLYRFISWI